MALHAGDPGAVSAAGQSIAVHASRQPYHAQVATAIEQLALVAALYGNYARAAVLEGYAAGAFDRQGFDRELTALATHLRLETILNQHLTPEELTRRGADGAALTPESAIAIALAQE